MGAEAKRSVRELPIACGLSDLEQRKRREELSRQVFSGCQRTDELDDGYEFVFPGGPEWAEKLGGHLVKRSYSEPRWSRKQGAVG